MKNKKSTKLEKKEEAPPIPPKPVKKVDPKDIFSEEKIAKIYTAEDPIRSVSYLLQDHHRKINGNADFDEEKLMAKAEFHVNNLVFLKETYSYFDDEAIAGLMNVLAELIEFPHKKDTTTLNNSRFQ